MTMRNGMVNQGFSPCDCLFCSIYCSQDVAGTAEFPGDFRNINPEGGLDFGWDTFDEETKLEKRAVELNQGRAAMMGLLGLVSRRSM